MHEMLSDIFGSRLPEAGETGNERYDRRNDSDDVYVAVCVRNYMFHENREDMRKEMAAGPPDKRKLLQIRDFRLSFRGNRDGSAGDSGEQSGELLNQRKVISEKNIREDDMDGMREVKPQYSKKRWPEADLPAAAAEEPDAAIRNADPRAVQAVRGVNLDVAKGEIVALVGESGSGKTALCRSILRLHAAYAAEESGQILLCGRDVLKMNEREMEQMRGTAAAIVFQDPLSSLDPVRTVGEQILTPMRLHRRPIANRSGNESVHRKNLEYNREYEYIEEKSPEDLGTMISGSQNVDRNPGIGLTEERKSESWNGGDRTQGHEKATGGGSYGWRRPRRMSAADGELVPQAVALLRDMGLDDPERRFRQYPHELSGGQRQRVAIAIALAGDPELLIADEPTTALDPDTQNKIRNLIGRIAKEQGKGVLFVTHDLRLARGLADRIAVMKEGRIVECGEAKEIFTAPKEEYTKRLIRYADYGKRTSHYHGHIHEALEDRNDQGADGWLVRAEHLWMSYRRGRETRTVLEDYSLEVREDEILGIVGASGCGKSTLAKVLMGIAVPQKGTVQYRKPCVKQLIFQDSAAAFDERMTLARIIEEPLVISGYGSGGSGGRSARKDARRRKVMEVIRAVHLEPELLSRHPYEVSGGQRQRAAIARALITDPDFLIADEPVTSLDVPIQAEIIHLLRELHDRRGLTMILIAHDLPMVEHVSDRIVRMGNK